MIEEVVRCLEDEDDLSRRFWVLLVDVPLNKPEMRETPDVNRLIVENSSNRIG